jgi:2-amino-4-hydroxy-6-hydroxymethyldihydropteridine diphosphokinase
MPVTAYIALGSNLGDRRAFLDGAVAALQARPGLRVGPVSSYHETDPVGGPSGQGKYLNAALAVETELTAEQLLGVLQGIEQQFGRVRTEKDGPRTLDLDLLLYGDLVHAAAELTVPHPRLTQRSFVLEPLAEIAPQAVDPVTGETVQTLLHKLRSHNASAPAGRELAGLRALVTGSTSGIGRAIARGLAQAGADVLVHGRRSPPAARSVVEEIGALGVRGSFLMADLRTAEGCRELAQRAWSEWGGLDIWVNNAGADTLTGGALHWRFERKLAELLAVDVTATMLLSRDIGRRMKNRGRGCLVNMGWDQADTGLEGDSGQLFGATKAAVMAFSKSVALSLAPEVRVNCVAPGWIRTAWGETASQHWQERVRRETPLGRWGTPEDVAAAVRWLVSPAAAFVTGQVLRINGGVIR